MPITPDSDRNFILGISDFWQSFFKDSAELKTLYDGVQLSIGQIYLDLLQATLNPSLNHTPLFSKKYFKYISILETQLKARENGQVGGFTYDVLTNERYGALACLMNKVVAATALLEEHIDYSITDAAIKFNSNLFNVDGNGGSIPLFPVRYVSVPSICSYRDPLNTDWAAAGALPGDILQLTLFNGAIRESEINHITNGTLYLDSNIDSAGINQKSYTATVLREGYNSHVSGELSANYFTTASEFNATVQTSTVNIVADPKFKGSWTFGFTFNAGDFVSYLGSLYKAKVTHISGMSFDPNLWISYSNAFIQVVDPDKPENNGFYYIGVTDGSGNIYTSRPFAFTPNTGAVKIQLALTVSVIDQTTLAHPNIKKGSVKVIGERAFNIISNGVAYAAGDNLVEGVDYLIDYTTGLVKILSIWNAGYPVIFDYVWRKKITQVAYTYKNTFVQLSTYSLGDIVTYNNFNYICIQNSPGTLSPNPIYFTKISGLLFYNESVLRRELALWAADAEIDNEVLYNNFGSLLGNKKITSESYRTFLRGVSQLFLLGPTFSKFESALNVIAGLPVIRNDGEILVSYDSGVEASGSDGILYDAQSAHDGVLTVGSDHFSSASATFFPSDIGAKITINNEGQLSTYIVSSVINVTTVVVSPPVAATVTGLNWTFEHVLQNKWFQTFSRAFTQADVGKSLYLDSVISRNTGKFKITSVLNSTTVTLAAEYALFDQTSVNWRLSSTDDQTVTTTQNVYSIPIGTPVRDDIKDSSNYMVLTFKAVEALTEAFIVEDYVKNPTWWHNTTIPQEILPLLNNDGGRRIVTPQFIEHTFSPQDQAVIGDFGLIFGRDDNGMPGMSRNTMATWYGGNTVVLATGLARLKDVGTYLIVQTPFGDESYQINSVTGSGTILELNNFDGTRFGAPPMTLAVRLAPIIYRRAISFVLMDKFLKFHAIHIKFDPSVAHSSEFISDLIEVVNQAKPAHTFIYLEPTTNFVDTEQFVENFTFEVQPFLADFIGPIDNTLLFNGAVQVNDAYIFTTDAQAIVSPGDGNLTLTLPNPGYAPDRQMVLFIKIDGLKTSGGADAKDLINWTFDYATNVVTFTGTRAGDNITINLLICNLRTRLSGDTLIANETRVCFGGADPTSREFPGQGTQYSAIIDRAVEIAIS